MKMTRHEVVLIVILISALLLGAVTKHYRHASRKLPATPLSAPARPGN